MCLSSVHSPTWDRLEQDVKKLKADLQASRQVEQDLRSQIGSLGSAERSIRTELGQLRQENELLQNKWVGLLFTGSKQGSQINSIRVIQTHSQFKPWWIRAAQVRNTDPAALYFLFVNVLFYVVCPCTRRLHNAVQAKQKDKQAVGQLEKRLKAEQEARATAEKQLADEKKRKKLEEATAARAVALAAASR